MLACLDADLDAIFSTDDFGETVTLNGVEIVGHFDDEDIEANMGEGPTQIVAQPKFTCKLLDVEEDQILMRGAERFIVRNWKRDGVGVIILFLERA